MRILLYSDPHWCKNSSILRRLGNKYSMRIENLIMTLSWIEQTAAANKCGAVICAGDFFDRADLNAMELTALSEINKSNIKHYYVVGNHEIEQGDNSLSTTHLFSLLKDSIIIDKPEIIQFEDTEIAFLPYILEADRKPINEYFPVMLEDTKRIIISHNDIKGIQLGPWLTQTGFEIADIEANCNLCFNGHIHNGGQVGSRTYNIGNVTGLNFNEDATQYKHGVYIIDTDTLAFEFIENPSALKFYKIDEEQLANADLPTKFDEYSVVTWRAHENRLDLVKSYLAADKNVVASRVLLIPEVKELDGSKHESLVVNHLQKFREFIMSTIGTDKITMVEIEEVVK